MSVEMACTCPDGFGLPHSHVSRPALFTVAIGTPVERIVQCGSVTTGWVRLWVDWKAVARA